MVPVCWPKESSPNLPGLYHPKITEFVALFFCYKSWCWYWNHIFPEMSIYLDLPKISKGCQMVAKGCQFTILWGFNWHPLEGAGTNSNDQPAFRLQGNSLNISQDSYCGAILIIYLYLYINIVYVNICMSSRTPQECCFVCVSLSSEDPVIYWITNGAQWPTHFSP